MEDFNLRDYQARIFSISHSSSFRAYGRLHLYPDSPISPKVVPLCGDPGRQLDAQVHLLHVLRRFDWFVDTYVSDPPQPDFKRIASDFESQVLAQAKQKLEAFQKRHFKDIRIANTDGFRNPLQANY
jgi:hypothetical protein